MGGRTVVWPAGRVPGQRGAVRRSGSDGTADFDLTDDNAAAVAEICERLDHVPLAIELAAARVRGLSPADIARRLDQRLRLLTSSDRLAPGRHQTLDTAVRWSYELLDDAQQRVFDRLSVFAGGFTIEAAEAVVAGDGVDEWEVLDGILALVDKSLVIADEGAGGSRYRLLETMRQFGQANLADVGALEQHRSPCRLLRRLRALAPFPAPRLRGHGRRGRSRGRARQHPRLDPPSGRRSPVIALREPVQLDVHDLDAQWTLLGRCIVGR